MASQVTFDSASLLRGTFLAAKADVDSADREARTIGSNIPSDILVSPDIGAVGAIIPPRVGIGAFEGMEL